MAPCTACASELPDAAFAFCPWCGAPVTVAGDGRRKTVTILFADLVGSTELGSRLDPEVLRGVLASYWDMARQVVADHGGTVEKFIGDAVVGVFGIPTAHEDDALRAVRAAADLQTGVGRLNVDLSARHGVQLALRVGVNSGTVMVGTADANVSLMAGDAANVGARLEQAAAAGDVLLGEATYALVRDRVEVEAQPPLPVKGKAQPIEAFRLRRVPADDPPFTRRRFSGPLVGRRGALEQVQSAHRIAVDEKACVLMTVVGPAGIGKSRLVEEFLSGIHDEALVLTGRCLPYGPGITYLPLIQIIQRLPEQAPTVLADGPEDDLHQGEMARGLDALMGGSTPASPTQVAWSVRRLLERLSRSRPVVVVIDDVQWAEPALLDLLEHVATRAVDSSILLLCLGRSEFLATRPGWGREPRVSFSCELAPLTAEESALLIEGLLDTEIDPRLFARVNAAASGVPLFIEEFIAGLADQSLLAVDASGARPPVGVTAEIRIPPTVEALLTARLDALPPAERSVLDCAAVIGQTFYPDLVAAVHESGTDAVPLLLRLERADFVRRVETDLPGHDAYGFSHLLVRDAAYRELPKARRAVAHAGVAHWLDSTSAAQTTPELVASHMQQAAAYRKELGDPDVAYAERTARRLVTCAHRARLLGDAAGATAQLNAAEALVPAESPIGLAVSLARVETAILIGDYANAAILARRAQESAARAGDDRSLWHARLHECELSLWTDVHADADSSLALSAQAVIALGALGDDAGVARARSVRCIYLVQDGRFAEVAVEAEQGLAAAKRANDLTAASRLISHMMWVCWDGDASASESQRVLDRLSRTFGQEELLRSFFAWQRLAMDAFNGQIEDAMAFAARGAELALDQEDLKSALRYYVNMSRFHKWSGELTAAVADLASADAVWANIGEDPVRSTFLAHAALLHLRLGELGRAREVIADSHARSNPHDAINLILYALFDGLIAAHEGDADQSEHRFAAGAEFLANREFWEARLELSLLQSTARELLGDPVGATAAAREALRVAELKGFQLPIRAAQDRLGHCDRVLAGRVGETH